MNESVERTYRISEITSLIKENLEEHFSGVAVEGEISNFRPASSGHLYFTLKDAEATLQAVMFRGKAFRLDFAPADGQVVVARGSISVYPKRGNYQIICESMKKAGEGALLAMLEERKRRFAAEGLFDGARKRALPLFPRRVGVVTSPTGAALQDILEVVRRRSSGLDLVILPATVQGEGAAMTIARQIRIANLHRMVEVLIVGRGGGSLEDLLPFSEEVVVRAVAESEIPVVSAVGHEVDVALSDLAADVRAPTPSAAAEMVTARREELLERVRIAAARVRSSVVTRVERAELLLQQFRAEALERNFRVVVQPLLLRLDDAKESLIRAMSERAIGFSHRVELARRELESISPAAIIGKGYAVVTERGSGRAIYDAKSQRPGGKIDIRVARGSLGAAIEEIRD